MDPATAKGLSAPQSLEHPWGVGELARRGEWEKFYGADAGQCPPRSPGYCSKTAPRRASRPSQPLPSPLCSFACACKASHALPLLLHFPSPPPRQLSVWLGSSRRRPSVPWMPRSSPCWPLCWLRSASATVSVLGGGGRIGAKL